MYIILYLNAIGRTGYVKVVHTQQDGVGWLILRLIGAE